MGEVLQPASTLGYAAPDPILQVKGPTRVRFISPVVLRQHSSRLAESTRVAIPLH